MNMNFICVEAYLILIAFASVLMNFDFKIAKNQ